MTTRRGFLGALFGGITALTDFLTRKPRTPAAKSATEAFWTPGGGWLGPYSFTTSARGFRVSYEVVEDDRYGILREVNDGLIRANQEIVDAESARAWLDRPVYGPGFGEDLEWDDLDDDYDW